MKPHVVRISVFSVMIINAAIALFLALTRVPSPPPVPPPPPVVEQPEFRLVLDRNSVLHITKTWGLPIEIQPLDLVGLFKVYGQPDGPDAPTGSLVEGEMNFRKRLHKQLFISSEYSREFPVIFKNIDPVRNQPIYCDLITRSPDGETYHHRIPIELGADE